MKNRSFGLLVPISALPSGEGIGTLGESAFHFIDFLSDAGAEVWQILPIVPVSYGDSPYQSCCSTALNYYNIDLFDLISEGLLTEEEVASCDFGDDVRRVNYGKLFTNKTALLRTAFKRFNKQNKDFVTFVANNEYSDFAEFMSLKVAHDYKAWTEWDEKFRLYNRETVNSYINENYDEYLFWQFTQYLFLKQWNAVREYAHNRGILIMGDIPLYLAYDSVEVWKYGDIIFEMDDCRQVSRVAGVPPDLFTADGQLWGNPLYNWRRMKEDHYLWWNKRLENSFKFFDILRIDHFRGFDRYYCVPAAAETAREGVWEDGPKEEFFNDKLDWNIVAEDLGVVDEGILRLMKNVRYPGMKVLEFAFDGLPDNEHKPSNFERNVVCYTGTHDNMPLRQYIEDLSEKELETFRTDLYNECVRAGISCDLQSPIDICHTVVQLAFYSVADTVIIPLNDILALGGESRINLPGTLSCDNWSFRYKEEEFDQNLSKRLLELAEKTDRISVK